MWSILFDRVDFKRVSIGVLIVVVFALGAVVKIQNDQLATAKVVYGNPRVVTLQRVVRIAGPVRIVTRVVERSSGEKESTTIEDRGSILETTASTHESTPVALADALASPRSDKWLLGLGNRNFSYRSWEQYSLWAGHELGPIVVQAGAGYKSLQTVVFVKF